MSEKSKVPVPSRARGSEPGTRLDSTVISRHTGEEGYIVLDNDKFIEVTNVRVIKTGNRIEIYTYERPIKLHVKNHKRKVTKTPQLMTPRDQEYRNRRAHRANNTIRRLANGNFSIGAKFLTLTFNNDQDFDISSIRECNKRHSIFIKKLQKIYPDMKYISVLEFQKRGAVHYHILNNLPFIDKEEITALWGHGFIDIREIKDTDSIGGYIAKYMVKNCTDPRFADHRTYFASKNLERPEVIYGFKTKEYIEQLLNVKPVFQNNYKTIFNGVVEYEEYNLATHDELNSTLPELAVSLDKPLSLSSSRVQATASLGEGTRPRPSNSRGGMQSPLTRE